MNLGYILKRPIENFYCANSYLAEEFKNYESRRSYEEYLEKYSRNKKYGLYRYLYELHTNKIIIPIDDYTVGELLKDIYGEGNVPYEDGEYTYNVIFMINYFLNNCKIEELAMPGVDIYIGFICDGDVNIDLFRNVGSVHFKCCTDINDYLTWTKAARDVSVPFVSTINKPFSMWSANNKVKHFLNVIEETQDESFQCNKDASRLVLYKGIFDSTNTAATIASEIDYIHYITMRVLYYFMWRQGVVPNGKMINSCKNLKNVGEQIIKYADKDDPCFEMINNGRIRVPEKLKKLHKKLEKYMPFNINIDEFNFNGLIQFINELRNDTKGHGVIQDEMADVIIKILLYYISFIHKFLVLEKFSCMIAKDVCFAGYEGREMEGRTVFFNGEYTPNLLWECKKNNNKYMNFFEGEYIVPSI